ncbi:MAG TPA: hypothetical protein VE404_02390 [Verrucomicrobiae bacterium]|nr:hypothetical protein [Verrucomicrobiae bacterium]
MNDSEAGGGAAQDPYVPPTAPSVQPGPEPAPLATRLVGVVASPGATFKTLVARPAWAGMLAIYLVALGVSALVYSLNVDWEGLMKGQFEESTAWKLASSMLPEDKLGEIEHAAVEEVVSTGSGGMALLTTANTVIGGAIGFMMMGVIYGTLFYLMGAVGDLKLGRVYLDAFLALLMAFGWVMAGAILRGVFFSNDSRAALPWQAGLNAIFFLVFLYMLHGAVERQPAFRRVMSVYAHGMVISAISAILVIAVVLMQSEPVTVGADQILKSNLGVLAGVKGTGLAATLLGSLDIFTVWQLVVLSIGFAALTGFSVWTSASITFLPWGFVTMVKVAIATLFGG